MVPDGYPVDVDRRVFVTVSDGTRIALTVYRPLSDGDGAYPAIVESLPYRKDDDCFARDHSTYSYLASRGFVGVRVDVRGTGASTGVIADEYLAIEQQDNLEVLDWITAQPWSNGRVGMWGISWGGFSALQTAMLRPPQLGAVLAMHATHDRFACDVHYTGGSLHAAEQVDWPTSMIATNALPPDPDIVGTGWYDEWIERLEKTPQWPLEWLRHQHRDAYWLHGSPCADYAAIECPTMLIGGWLDGYVDGMLAMADNLSCPTRTVIGPWGHHRPASGIPGPTIDHFELMARWFGHHLRGDDNQIMDLPEFTWFSRRGTPYDSTEAAGRWRSAASWPPDRREESIVLADLAHDSTSWSGPQWVGSHAPAWDRSEVESGDGAIDDQASITFETAPLEESIEILGSPWLDLTVSTDRPFGLVAARLLIVSAEGASHLITRASRNLAFPGGLDEPRSPEPGSPMSIAFPLAATSAVIPAGSRLRLALAGADFPVAWPPQARFTLRVDPARSTLVIPVIGPGPATPHILPAPRAHPEPPVEVVEESDEWEVEKSAEMATFRRRITATEVQPDRGMLTYHSDREWSVAVSPDDPGTTRARGANRLELSRTGWHVEVVGTMEISGRDGFQVSISLDARLDGASVFSRRWNEEIPRDWS